MLFRDARGFPYVYCDQETYNDQIYIFQEEENAKGGAAEEYGKQEIPVQVLKVENKDFLNFYSSLYFLGINAMLVDEGRTNRWKFFWKNW